MFPVRVSPVHVTLKLRSGLPRLRSKTAYDALRAAFAAGCARGLQGLLIRIAKALNKLWSRRGSVFADCYHDHTLKSSREVRNALRYLFGNGKKHAAEGREISVPQAIDTLTSAPWFTGFRERITVHGIEAVVRPVTDAHTWLLTEGWLRHGRISVHEVPVTA
jgi:hypothetical protein